MCHFLRGTTVLSISENKCGCSKLRQVYHKSLFIKCRPGNHGSNPPPPTTTKKDSNFSHPLAVVQKAWEAGCLPSLSGKKLLMGRELPQFPASCAHNAHWDTRPHLQERLKRLKETFLFLSPFFVVISKETYRAAWRFCGPLTIHKPSSG